MSDSKQPRWLIDRRVAAVAFATVMVGVPLHVVQRLGDALGDPSLHAWLLFNDAALRALVWALFAVLIWRRRPSRRPARSARAFVSCAAAILPVMLLASPAAQGVSWPVLAGEVVVVLALGVTLASVLALGTCFGILPEVRGMVTRGPYRFVRHPVYAGEIAALAGFAFASQRLVNLVAVIVFCAAQAVRLRLEEAALLAEFPDEYGAYAARTPRLLPRLPVARRRGAVLEPA